MRDKKKCWVLRILIKKTTDKLPYERTIYGLDKSLKDPLMKIRKETRCMENLIDKWVKERSIINIKGK